MEGLAFEEKEHDLYWTCQTDATINRMSVDPARKKLVEKIVHLDPADKPRGIVVDSCDLYVSEELLRSEMMLCLLPVHILDLLMKYSQEEMYLIY